jgi:thiol:disulfide interchange protein DsbD
MYDMKSCVSNCVSALLVLSLLALIHSPVDAEPQTNSSTDDLVTFSVHPGETDVSAGGTFLLHFHARIKPEWHIYWKNPGETGMATDISIDAPEGFDVGTIQWPRPITFKTGEITSYGYKDETVLTVPVKAPEALPERPYNFSATITSLVCREKCLMQNQKMTFSLDDMKQPDKALRGKIRSFREAVPEPFSSLESSRVTWNKGSVVFHGPRGDAEDIRFYPIAIPGVELGSPSISIDGQTFTVRVPVEWHPENHLGKEKPAVKGVIGLGKEPTDPGYYVSAPLKKEQVAE